MENQHNRIQELTEEMRADLANMQDILGELESAFIAFVVELDTTPEGRAHIQAMARLTTLNDEIAHLLGGNSHESV